MGIDPLSGSNPTRGTGQQHGAALPVPSSVTSFLGQQTSTAPFFNKGSHDIDAFKLVKSLPPEIGDFFAEAGALQSAQSNKLMFSSDDAGNKYVLYPHTPNLWAKNMHVYGMAITPEGNRVIVKGSVEEKKWGGQGQLSLEATGKVFGPKDNAALLGALREERAAAATAKK